MEFVNFVYMRTDSCRTCGEDMQEFQRCHTCNEVIRLICSMCNKTGEAQIHPNCEIFDNTVILN